MIRQYLLASGVLALVLLAPSAGQGHEDETTSIPALSFNDSERQGRYSVQIVTDDETGCQYIWVTRSAAYAAWGGLTARLDEDGEPMGCHREDE